MKKTNPHRQAWARLLEGQSFIIACHQRPDGDTIGSSLALAHALRRLGKDAVIVSADGLPDGYDFIPESDTIVTSTDRRGFDFGVLVDSEGTNRVGPAEEAVLSSKSTACIDHHQPNGGFGEVRVVDTSASSTAELVVEFLQANEVEIDNIMATQLMAGLVSDTGAFRFANVTPRTFRVAALLMELGAKPSEIARAVYESRPLQAMKLMGRAMSSLQTDPTGQVVWAVITGGDMQETGTTDADTESVVNLVRWVKGPRVAILFRETKPNSIRTSLRSSDGVDVDRVARVFGGGGHKAAAGCTLEASLDEAVERVVGEVLKWTAS